MKIIILGVKMHSFVLAVALMAGTAQSLPVNTHGNTQINRFQSIANRRRAQNLARFAGERVNGGIAVYRTEPAMHHVVGTKGEARYEDVGDAWIFTFRGGSPEDTAAGRFTIQTVVRVEKDTFKTTVLSNQITAPEKNNAN